MSTPWRLTQDREVHAASRLDVLKCMKQSEGQAYFGLEKGCIDSHNKGRNGPHNSVPVVIVLYWTVCT